MSEVTQILNAVDDANPHTAEQLLPLIYDELRKLAAQKLAQEKPGQTLQATALVHEAFLRLLDDAHGKQWDNRGHYFAAAAEAMRRILVEDARRKSAVKHGGEARRLDVDVDLFHDAEKTDEILAVDEALAKLAIENPTAASLVKFRYFAGMTLEETASTLQISVRTAHRYWNYARAWMHHEIGAHGNFHGTD